jgi:hypothetical protein
MENPMKNKTLATFVAAAFLATAPSPALAWVAAGGYHGGVAVGYHPPCCYGGAAVAGAAVAGAMVGAAVVASSQPVYAAPVYAAPAPVYYAAPDYYAPVGTVVASLPGTCSTIFINGVTYMYCASTGAYYVPYYSGGSLLYQVSSPP